jgi:hypothetical protein
METSIPAKFYYFMVTDFLRADKHICQNKLVSGTNYLRNYGITSALLEVIGSFTHLKANKMPFQIVFHISTFRTVVL